MTPSLSANTQAILLLTAPLLTGSGRASPELLTLGEYKRLARQLLELQRQPSDLMHPDASTLLRLCHPIIDESRLQRLLGRGFLLSQVIEHWRTRAVWVISRADFPYPRRLKARLREDAPPLLYGCGDIGLLETGGLSVVGSRDVDDSLIHYTMAVSGLVARAGRTLVSGGARGIDQAAMRGALEAGGKVCGVLADSLEKAALNREYRSKLMNGQLVLISPFDPAAGFNVGNAMQRNKLIYALGNAALVVNSDLNKGGTWAGASEQIKKFKFVPVYVRSTEPQSAGLAALRAMGALPWPDPVDVAALNAVLVATPEPASSPPQMGLNIVDVSEEAGDAALTADSGDSSVKSAGYVADATVEVDPAGVMAPADMVFQAVRKAITQLLGASAAAKDVEIAASLQVSVAQIRVWLRALVEQGVIGKQKRPAGYVLKQSQLSTPSMAAIALPTVEANSEETTVPADVVFKAVREAITHLLGASAPAKDIEIAASLQVSAAQSKVWLQALVEQGVIEKQKRRAVYGLKQAGLF